ncbi:MAG: VTT domain-containing protein [Pelovirga sp.]
MKNNKPCFNLNIKKLVLLVLVLVGLVLAVLQPIEIATLLKWGQLIGTSPLFVATAMILIAGLFTFGLPGSLGLWLIAPFNPPWLATLLLVAISTTGALGGYAFSAHIGYSRQGSPRSDKVVDILRRNGNVFTLTALRMLPGFPHSAINFGCGVLRLPLPGFIASTVVGCSIKWGVYASAIHGITDTVEASDAIRLDVLLPLFLLVVLGLVGAWVKRKFECLGCALRIAGRSNQFRLVAALSPELLRLKH